MPNIIELGINVDSFNEQKMARLNEYISLFDKLSQYDGKVYNPILGNGLTEFNQSLASTSKLLDEINVKMAGLNKTVSSNAVSTASNTTSTAAYDAEMKKLLLSVTAQQKEITALKLQLSELSKQIVSGSKDIEVNDENTKRLTLDAQKLRQALKDQAQEYSNLYLAKGKNSIEAKQALENYSQTAAVTEDISKKLNNASGSALGFGHELKGIYNQVRILAYILPGIGVAGIFTLGFEAIKSAMEYLGLFDDEINETLKLQDKQNQTLNEQLSILEDLKKAGKEYFESLQKANGIRPGDKNPLSPENKLNADEARGLDAVTLSTEKLDAARDKLTRSKFYVDQHKKDGETDEAITDRLEKQKNQLFSDISGKSLELSSLKDEERQLNYEITEGYRLNIRGLSPAANLLERHDNRTRLELVANSIKEKESSLGLSKTDYKSLEEDLNGFYEAKKNASDESLAHQKLLADEERKLQLSLSKDRISLITDAAQRVLRLETSTEKQRIAAINRIKDAQIELNKSKLENVLNNPSSTQADKDIARSSFSTDNLQSERKANEEILKLIESNRQARLKATSSLNKDIIEEDAISNQKIYKDENQSLSDRLSSYNKYIIQKQSLRDLDYALEIDILSKMKNKDGSLDETAAVKIKSLAQHKESEKANVQADVENQVYDITFSSLQKQLKLVVEENSNDEEENKKHYTIALNDLNKSYDDKLISYKKYREKLKKLTKEYETEDLKEAVDNDNEHILRLQEELDRQQQVKDQADKDVDTAKVGVEVVNGFGGDKLSAKKSLDTAVGEQKAAADSIKKIQDDLHDANNKKTDDENKLAKSGISTKEKDEEKWYKYAIKVENELYREIKSFVDAGYEYRVSMLEKQKAIIDEQYGYEIAAIEKSSLSAKDKAALQIQLSEQKVEYDKKIQADEKRVKIQQAEFDKKLTIMHIILDTAESVMSKKPPSPAAITAGIIGGIELGVAAATPIPSFKEGVKGFKGGIARYGEDGAEILKIPSKAPRLITTETISYLPAGTDIVPIKDDVLIKEKPIVDGWEQTIWLAKQMKKNNKQPKVVNNNIIKIDLGFETYKKQILGN